MPLMRTLLLTAAAAALVACVVITTRAHSDGFEIDGGVCVDPLNCKNCLAVKQKIGGTFYCGVSQSDSTQGKKFKLCSDTDDPDNTCNVVPLDPPVPGCEDVSFWECPEDEDGDCVVTGEDCECKDDDPDWTGDTGDVSGTCTES
jgi:hypothetical protein